MLAAQNPEPDLSEPDIESTDYVVLRGHRLQLSRLVDQRLFDADYLEELRSTMAAAIPFPHLVLNGWFSAELLSLIDEEFALRSGQKLRPLQSRHESTFRSQPGSRMGPASRIYFGLVNSDWFVDLLSYVSGVSDLLPDVALLGGGLHETRAAGKFAVHRDFDRHLRTGLLLELGFVTFLNDDWNADWGGALELWDEVGGRALRSIAPTAGCSVLLRHGARSYHGHPAPLAPPPGRSRRSVMSYYYSNPEASWMRAHRVGTAFLNRNAADRLKAWMQFLLPPAFWYALKRLRGR